MASMPLSKTVATEWRDVLTLFFVVLFSASVMRVTSATLLRRSSETQATARSQDAIPESKYVSLSFSWVRARVNERATDTIHAFMPSSVLSRRMLLRMLLAAPMRYAMTDTMHVATVNTAMMTMSATNHPGMRTTGGGGTSQN